MLGIHTYVNILLWYEFKTEQYSAHVNNIINQQFGNDNWLPPFLHPIVVDKIGIKLVWICWATCCLPVFMMMELILNLLAPDNDCKISYEIPRPELFFLDPSLDKLSLEQCTWCLHEGMACLHWTTLAAVWRSCNRLSWGSLFSANLVRADKWSEKFPMVLQQFWSILSNSCWSGVKRHWMGSGNSEKNEKRKNIF